MSSARPSKFRRPPVLTPLQEAQALAAFYAGRYREQLEAQHWWMTWGITIALWVGIIVGVIIGATFMRVLHG